MNDDAKPFWMSRGVIGSVVMLLATAARCKGWAVDTDATTDFIIQAIQIVGALVALWGRVKATQPIKWTRGTMPGGPFNPKAEVEKAKPVPPGESGGVNWSVLGALGAAAIFWFAGTLLLMAFLK